MAATDNKLSATMEDYLETIYSLKEENGFARVGEIATKMSVTSASVNSAIKSLCAQHLVIHEKYGYVGLTDQGNKLASEIKSKHDILFRFLTEFLMLDPTEAEQEACCIEHAISKETYVRLTKFFKFLELGFCEEKPKILQHFAVFLETGKRLKCDCEE